MKKNIIAKHTSRIAGTTSPNMGGLGGLSLFCLALALLTSCSNDEQTLADGSPITFTAAGIASTTTRSTVNGDWDGVNGVAIQIGSDVKQYAVTPNTDDNTKATLKAASTPFYWNSTSEEKTVTAWYPYNDGTDPTGSWTVKADQSVDANYIASDLLKVSSQKVTYDNPTLTFEHQVAKIVVKADISNLPSTATLSSASLKGVSGVESGTAITMHKQADNIYEAIVTSQSPTSARFILPIDNIGTYTYSFETDTWKAANSYTYTLSVSGNELTLTNCTIEPWTSEEAVEKTLTPYTTVDVSTLSSDAVIPDKTVLTGTTTNGITIAAGATVAFKDLTVETSSASAIKCLGDATIYIIGTNTAKTTKNDCCGIEAGASGTTLTIDGSGSLKATAGDYAAAIGSGFYSSCGNITINGGMVTATGGESAAGIGSGYSYSSCGNITINGGTVTAAGGEYGVGIGSGYSYSSCGNITINGGSVTATGSENGAGIGSGNSQSSCGNITINGGSVTAAGGKNGAGIGSGGYYSSCGNITINGGMVTAAGGESAAGIGSGACGYKSNYYSYTVGDIKITGGTIVAKAKLAAAAIGTGKNSQCKNITITNGVTSVTVTKNDDHAAYIGLGLDGRFYNDGGTYSITIDDDAKAKIFKEDEDGKTLLYTE